LPNQFCNQALPGGNFLTVHNTAASVRQKLKNLARSSQENFNLVLTRFGLERLLYRISVSSHAELFTLKGGTLFYCWTQQLHRPTRDLDFLGAGDADAEKFLQVFQEILQQEVPDDGMLFDPQEITADSIRDNQEYHGIRVTVPASLGSARLRLQVDIGFGDTVTPYASSVKYPALLDFPQAEIQAYSMETVIAEKFQAMVELGISNSRMKDFYDIWKFATEFEIEPAMLKTAVHATFERRLTPLPQALPVALSDEFAAEPDKQTQWGAFCQRVGCSVTLPEVIQVIRPFLLQSLSL